MKRVTLRMMTLLVVMVVTLLMAMAGCGGDKHHDRDGRDHYSGEHERHDSDRHDDHGDR